MFFFFKKFLYHYKNNDENFFYIFVIILKNIFDRNQFIVFFCEITFLYENLYYYLFIVDI